MTAEPAATTSRRASWWLSGLATAGWLLAVLAFGLVGRVAEQWESAVTMLFGSFLAGSSPEGGGAVAFPVFTKALQVPSPVARTFGLSIQAVGMTMASIAIVRSGRPFHRRAALLGSAVAVAAFVVAVALLSDSDALFRPPSVSAPWVKASFSIVLATTSVLMLDHLRRHLRRGEPVGVPAEHPDHLALAWGRRLDVGLVVAAVAGGVLASLTGTGANIAVFLFLVVLAGVGPKEALPTAIMVMAAVSVVGFVLLGVLDGQLDVDVVADRVVAVGGVTTDLDADRTDLLGLWLAAVPVVVWGAPLGSLAASMVDERVLVRFVAVLAAIEVATTVLLVPELRSDPALIAYLLLGLIALPPALLLMRAHRQRIFAAG